MIVMVTLNLKTTYFHQFGELRQNFSEVADFVTIYIAEVSSLKIKHCPCCHHDCHFVTIYIAEVSSFKKSNMAVVAIIIATLIVRPTQQRGVISVSEGMAAIMTLTPTITLQTG